MNTEQREFRAFTEGEALSLAMRFAPNGIDVVYCGDLDPIACCSRVACPRCGGPA